MLQAARRAVGRAAGTGGPEPDLTPVGLAAALEADAAARAVLDAAAAARLRDEPPEEPPATGVAAARRARADEVHHAAGALVLAGELVPDGPGRLRLPGFGPSTWRAIGVLRRGAGGAEADWARALVAMPAGDLGDAAPEGLRGLPADGPLHREALGLLAVEAERQDVRHELITTEASLARARERGEDAAARTLHAERESLIAALAAVDAAAAARWDAGVRRASGA